MAGLLRKESQEEALVMEEKGGCGIRGPSE